MLGRNNKRTRRRRLNVADRQPEAATERQRPEIVASNTGRLRPGQPEPKNVGTLWAQVGRRVGVLVLIIAIIVSLVNVLIISPHAKIEPLTSSKTGGAFLRDQAEYQAAADKLLASSIWNRNKITINTGQISRQLTERFPELSSASVTLPMLAHRPIVYVQPAEAALVVAANNGAFVIDQNGRALMPSANLPTARNLPQLVDQSGLPVRTGSQVLTSDDISFIQTVLTELGAKHVRVSSMVLPVESQELDVYIDGQPYFVKFNLANDDARLQAGTYLATAAQLKRQQMTPKKYVDVRVDGRAYYK